MPLNCKISALRISRKTLCVKISFKPLKLLPLLFFFKQSQMFTLYLWRATFKFEGTQMSNYVKLNHQTPFNTICRSCRLLPVSCKVFTFTFFFFRKFTSLFILKQNEHWTCMALRD